jgi:hypothetical protein
MEVQQQEQPRIFRLRGALKSALRSAQDDTFRREEE